MSPLERLKLIALKVREMPPSLGSTHAAYMELMKAQGILLAHAPKEMQAVFRGIEESYSALINGVASQLSDNTPE